MLAGVSKAINLLEIVFWELPADIDGKTWLGGNSGRYKPWWGEN